LRARGRDRNPQGDLFLVRKIANMSWNYFYFDGVVQAEIEGLSPVHLARLAHIRELIEIDGPIRSAMDCSR
jgi:hypothetical protein